MKVSRLIPPCKGKVLFSREKLREVPDESGCYVLSNHHEEIMYVGQTGQTAGRTLRARMEEHLDSPEKTAATKLGASFWFHYLVAERSRLNRIELGWYHRHEEVEGKHPILNKQRPPSP